ncbi:hypothetical protein GGF46_003045 [Coemansia sp. RSA 552]|nr:hypothetical protein GGF46_003045 [Coemansia sp. RSA 552]
MPLDRVSRAFHKLVADHYPIVAGRPAINKQGQPVMYVNPSNLCRPDIGEMAVDEPAEAFFETRPNEDTSKPDIRFFNMHKFHHRHGDTGDSALPKATYRRDNSSAIVRIIRFKDNAYVGVYVSLSHGIFDGAGAVMFFNHWAEYARNMDNPDYELDTKPVNDRSVARKYFDKVETIDPPYMAHLREIPMDLPVSMPADIAPFLMATPDIPAFKELHLIHISPKQLEQIRQDVDKSQTTNLALATLLIRCVTQANIKEFGSTPQMSYVMVPFDCRRRTEIPEEYTGNLSFSAIALLDPQQVVGGSYTDLAQAVKEGCSMVSSGHAKSTVDAIEREIAVLYKAGVCMCNSEATSYVGMTNLRYLPLFTLDFGDGGPDVVTCDYYIREGMARIYANKQDGGIDVYMNYKDELFRHLKESSELLKYADIVF